MHRYFSMQRGRDDVTYYDHVKKSCPSARQYGTYHSRRSFMRSYRDIGRPKPFLSHRPSGSSSRLTNRSDGRKRRAPAPPPPSSFFPSRERERREERIDSLLSCENGPFLYRKVFRAIHHVEKVQPPMYPVPFFFLPRKVCKPYDATVGCPKCKG